VTLPLIGKDSFQEVDIVGITMPITKHNYMVKDINRLADIIREAFYIAKSGRPGPVLIDVPKDIQQAVCEFEPCPLLQTKNGISFSNEELGSAVKLINNSAKPYIYAGGGVIGSDASKELIEFAELIDAPIGSSMMGLSAVPHDNKRFLGMTGMHGRYAATKLMQDSDLIIAIGTRFSDRATGNKKNFCSGKNFIHIDIDPAEIGKNVPVYVSLVGDVKKVLTRLNSSLEKTNREGWHGEVELVKNSPDNHLQMDKSKLNPQSVIEAVRRFAADDDVVATDVGQHQMWVSQYYKFSSPRTFITSGGLGTMGFGLGAAIGACIARGFKRTILFTSDGSFHMNLNEMATAVTNNLPIVIIVLNNCCLGMVRQWQTLFFGKRYSQTTMNRKTDFSLIANAFGAKSFKLEKPQDTEAVLKQAFSESGPCVVDVKIDIDEKVLPMIPPGGTIKDIILKA
ncbi:MAG: biosynthetic-type acetolactate synthase large subunit, partial [Clostridia bacterium]|nr:biosynthetic-type acetolactate synthase large subunit [Clostridia bacterium]